MRREKSRGGKVDISQTDASNATKIYKNFIIIHQLTWYFAMTFELQQLTYYYVRRRDHFTSQIQIYSSSQGFSGAFVVEMMAHNSFLKSGIN